MPIYEYQCESCGQFEIIAKASDAPLSECPQCQEIGKHSKVERVVSRSAFHLKGGGWYKDLYSTPASGSAAAKPAEGGAPVAADTSASTPKTEAAAPAKPAGCGTTCGCN